MSNFMSPPSLLPHSHHNQHHPSHQQQQPEADSSSATAVATILVRHLPEAIPQDMLSRLFSHYGAFSVRPCAGGKMRNCAFLDFKDESLAFQAQSQLNRLKFLGKVLSAERVGSSGTKKNADLKQQSQLQQSGKESLGTVKDASSSQGGNLVGRAEAIGSRLGVDYPFPPHLEYEYPPPDGNILTNIVNALIAVPRFYTQVLHLMNKMNLPAPFRMALPTPPLPPSVPTPSPPAVVQHPKVDLSSDESELESSDDDGNDTNRCKRVKREAILGPAVDKDIPHEAVGLRAVSLVPKELPVIKKKNPVFQIKIASKPKMSKDITDDGTKEVGELEQEQVEQKPYANPEDIERGKLPPEEILSLPMFKNYAAGNPATVLYIKNLAKDVAHDDFFFIFGSLFESIEAARSGLNIKLMQEGRMRGQAFVTFPSIDLAHRALNMVNGYVFKGKPMIIQFGRNPGAVKAT